MKECEPLPATPVSASLDVIAAAPSAGHPPAAASAASAAVISTLV